MTPRAVASAIDLLGEGLGDLVLEQLDDGSLELVRRRADGVRVGAFPLLEADLAGLADVVEIALVELRSPTGAHGQRRCRRVRDAR